MPPTVTVFPPISIVTAISFSFVSVVIIAFAAKCPASRVACFVSASFSIPAVTLSIGICIPITPVEPIRTPFASTPITSEAFLAVSLQ